MNEPPRLIRLIVLLLISSSALLAASLSLAAVDGAANSPFSTLTVCPAGPPQCDFAIIQAALDQAQSGDTVLVYAGYYQEKLTLKSGVSLQGTNGPLSTTIAASGGPIISATHILSASFAGFTVRGLLTTPLGVRIVDSQLTISNTIIEQLRGHKGTVEEPAGENAVAIQISGIGQITLTQTTIQDVYGGSVQAKLESLGGRSIGLEVWGGTRLAVYRSTIHRLYGGDVITDFFNNVDCQGAGGGDSAAIIANTGVNLLLQESEIVDLVGGESCYTFNGPTCPYHGGSAGAVHTAYSQQLTLKDNHIHRLFGSPAAGSPNSYAIHSTLTEELLLANNIIHMDPAEGNLRLPPSHSPTPPVCPTERASAFLVASYNDGRLALQGNDIGRLDIGSGSDARAVGLEVQGTDYVTVTGNIIHHIKGLAANRYTEHRGWAIGVHAQGNTALLFEANRVHNIQGGDPFSHYGETWPGGDAIGIQLTQIPSSTITNNFVWQISGGPWVGATVEYPSGSATALQISGGQTYAANNSLFQSRPGEVDDDLPLPGQAAGLHILQGQLWAYNNILADQGSAILAGPSAQVSADFNDYWSNETNFAGGQPGPNALFLDPRFVDGGHGDLHLSADSPLIDAGSSALAPAFDLDGDPRPLDGDFDWLATADIGADEYWYGLAGSVKQVDKLLAAEGERLTYTIILSHPAGLLAGVRLTDTLPAGTTYLSGSLAASAGSWGYASGAITWTGSVAAGQPVSLTFLAFISGSWPGPHLIVNSALADDPLGGAPLVRQATTLVNPRQVYFPVLQLTTDQHN